MQIPAANRFFQPSTHCPTTQWILPDPSTLFWTRSSWQGQPAQSPRQCLWGCFHLGTVCLSGTTWHRQPSHTCNSALQHLLAAKPVSILKIQSQKEPLPSERAHKSYFLHQNTNGNKNILCKEKPAQLHLVFYSSGHMGPGRKESKERVPGCF